MNLLQKLSNNKLIHPPKWLPENLSYLGYAGSVAYGASADTSDMDCVGFCVPPKHVVFPYSTGGFILGFGPQPQRFRTWVEHHVTIPNERKTYDFSVFNIVDFFDLAMQNNPNILDALFLPRRCILHSSKIGELIRNNRKLFLHKGAYHKYRGYAYAQMSNIEGKRNTTNPVRAELIRKHGYDTKFAMHVVRLALQAQQILVDGDLDIERNGDILRTVRNGEWTLDRLRGWFDTQEKTLESLYANSPLRHKPDVDNIRSVLLTCLEMAYGPLKQEDIVTADQAANLYRDVQDVLNKYSASSKTK